jgi:hypothetical protein
VFQERGVKPLDGMLSSLQANAHPFTDRALLPNVIADMVSQKVTKGEWANDWNNSLSVHMPTKPYGEAGDRANGMRPVRVFHVEVKNNHRWKMALNCYAVLEAIENAETHQPVPLETIELKWAGSLLPSLFIGPASSRRFDAFLMRSDQPSEVHFYTFCDSTEFYPKVPGPGTYLLRYGVYSSNFPATRRTFKLSHPGNMDGLKLEET